MDFKLVVLAGVILSISSNLGDIVSIHPYDIS